MRKRMLLVAVILAVTDFGAPKIVGGRRITDAATLDVMKMVLRSLWFVV